MKHTIKTRQGTFSIEPAKTGVLVKFKPHVWPEVMITLAPLEAAALADAVDLCATEAEAAS